MAVINFPDNPSDGATQTVGGITYTYSSSKGYWTAAASGGGGGGGASVTTDDTAPTSPSDGDLWYDTDDGGMFVYYADTDSSQWVEVIGSQGATGATGAAGAAGADGGAGVASVYATIDLLPLTGNTQGDMAHVTANNTLYFWNGSGWYKIALINTSPSISGVSSSYALASDGTATTVTITASDPEGLPITYSIASDTSGNIATVSQGTGASTNVFTITPSTNTAYAGSFTLTFRASDGVNIATAPATFTLAFKVTNSNYTTALITTAGSAGTNSTFTDSSSNSHTLTANGNTNQTSFSPYRSGGYSTLVGTSDAADYLSIAQDASINSLYSGDYTIEFWFNKQSERTQNFILSKGGQTTREWGIVVQSTAVIIYWSTNGASSGDASVSLSTTIDLNKWYHLALTFDSTTNTITVYLNGVSLGTGTFTSIYGGNGTLYIGKFMDYGAISHSCHAYIRDLRIVKGTKVYTSNFTPTIEPLTAITNTSLLTCHLPYLADGSTNNHTITSNGATSIEPVGPYEYSEYAVGDHGGSVYLDGNGDYLTVANDASLKPTGNFTAEGWCYVDGSNASGSIFNMWTSSQGRMWALYVSSTGVGLNGNSVTLISHTVNNLNKWVHVAFTRDNSNALCTLYVNGKSVGTSTTTFSGSSAPLAIGFNLDNAPASYYYNGSITDLRISDNVRYTSDFTPPAEPFTTDSNTALLLSGQGAVIRDKSQSVKTLTLVGNTTASTAQYKYLPTSMYFDGTGDYIITTQQELGTQDFTIELWMYATTASNTGIFESRSGPATDGFTLTAYTSSVIRIWSGSALISSTNTTYLNQWTHLAVCKASGTTTLYINGVSVGSTTSLGNLTNTDIVIGGGRYSTNSTVTSFFSGYIEDLRITKGLARYTANFTPPTAALQG